MLNYNPTTPILFIVFKHPATMMQVFEKIRNAQPNKLYIASYITLPPFPNYEHQQLEALLAQIDWACEVKTLFPENNAEKFRDPVSWFFAHEEEGIIVNDENLPDDSFFGFCSLLLEKYRNDNRIGHISGANIAPKETDLYTYYFSSLVQVSAWATWQRVWQTVDPDLESTDYFIDSNAIESSPSYTKYKENWLGQFAHRLPYSNTDTWDIPYTYNSIVNNYLSIVPTTNLVAYTGKKTDAKIPVQPITELTPPPFVLCNLRADWEEQEILYRAKNKDKLDVHIQDGYAFIKERFMELSKQSGTMKIPRIIHQIYEDPAGPSESLLELAETWKGHHPTWEYRFWGKKEMEDFLVEEFPEFIPIYRGYPFNVQRWDTIRYLILYRMGGLYVDFDYECLEPMDALLNNTLCCMGLEPTTHAHSYNKPFIVGNALMASVPGHSYFEEIIKDMMNDEKYSNLSKGAQVMQTTGPFMTTRLYNRYLNKEEITLLPADLVAPFTLFEVRELASGQLTPYLEDKIDKCFAIHYFGGSWHIQTR